MPSLRDHSSFIRPSTRDRGDRPSTREHVDNALAIPSRTSSLHSRITQPIPSTLQIKPNQRTPKTLTHAYMVCGVGREPSQWVRAPPPPHGKIGHMKGAVGQFWLPEILGSSPRLEQDNEIARALYAAMRVRAPYNVVTNDADIPRHASPTMSRSVPAEVSPIVFIIRLSYSKIRLIRSTVLLSEYGPERMRSVQRPSVTCAGGPNQTSMILRTRPTGFHTA